MATLCACVGCGSGAGPGGGGGGAGGNTPACAEVEPRPLGVSGVDDSAGALTLFDIRADATGPFFLLQQIAGGAANQTIGELVARLDGAPTTVYAQGNTVPDGMGLYTDGSGNPCALVSAGSASYSQCIGGAQQPTGLGSIATGVSNFLTPSSRIVSSVQSDGSTMFFTYGPFAALDGVRLVGGTFSTVEFTESSISFPGAAATAGGLAYACFVDSNDGLGVAGPGSVAARTQDGLTYRDCRMAGDGTRLYVAGVTDTDGHYVSLQPTITPGGGASALTVAPLALDATSPFDLVFFGGTPALVQLASDGTVALSAIAADGTLGPSRALATGASSLVGPVAIGPDGGIHFVAAISDHLAYVKRCP